MVSMECRFNWKVRCVGRFGIVSIIHMAFQGLRFFIFSSPNFRCSEVIVAYKHLKSTKMEIKHNLEINANASTIFNAVATEKGINGWWSKDCEVGETIGSDSTLRFDMPMLLAGALKSLLKWSKLHHNHLPTCFNFQQIHVSSEPITSHFTTRVYLRA